MAQHVPPLHFADIALAEARALGRGACHAQQGVALGLVQAEGLIHVGRAEGLELWGRIMGQDSTPHRPPTPATEGLEAVINRGRLHLLDVEELVPVVHKVAGGEPTKNTAERSLRPGVLWRQGSVGTQRAEGSRFVESMLAVVSTLKQPPRHVLTYLTAVCDAALRGDAAPSLLPANHQHAHAAA